MQRPICCTALVLQAVLIIMADWKKKADASPDKLSAETTVSRGDSQPSPYPTADAGTAAAAPAPAGYPAAQAGAGVAASPTNATTGAAAV
jgi:hypothetical protein